MQCRSRGSDERRRFPRRTHQVAQKSGRPLIVGRVNNSRRRRSDINGSGISGYADDLKKWILRAERKTNAFANGIFSRQVGFNEGAAYDHGAGSILLIGRVEETAIDKWNFQRGKIARAYRDDLAFVFLPQGCGAALDHKSNRAAPAARGNTRSLPHINHARQRTEAPREFVIEANRGRAVVGRSLVARISRIRQIDGEGQHVVKIETRILPKQRMEAPKQKSGTDQ